MNNLKIILSLSLSCLVTACGGGGGGGSSEPESITPQTSITKGFAQKGAFQSDSTLTFEAINIDGSRSGNAQTVKTTNNGAFEHSLSWKGWTLASVKGSYFNECNPQQNSTPLTLRAYSKSPETVGNINLMTHLIASRIDFLLANNIPLPDAWDKAQQDIKAFFAIQKDPALLDINQGAGESVKDNAALLLLSGAFSCHEKTIDFAKFSSDFADNLSFDTEGKTAFEAIQTTIKQPDALNKFTQNLKEFAAIDNPPNAQDLDGTPDWKPPSNNAPIAEAGSAQTVNAGNTVKLDGTKSTDSDGRIFKYQWTYHKTHNSPDLVLDNANTATPSFKTPTPLVNTIDLTFGLVVTDDDGSQSTEDTVTITINPTPIVNQIPTANAGQDQAVNSATKVTLNGSGTDTDGEIKAYQWTQVSGTSVDLSQTNITQLQFTAPTVNEDTVLTFELVVTDNNGAKSQADSVNITVKPIAKTNTAPTAIISNTTQTVISGDTVTLEASQSFDPDNNGSISQYKWSQIQGTPTINLGDTTSDQLTFQAPEVSSETTLTFQLIVTDNEQLDSSPTTATVHIKPSPNNQPIANAGNAQTVNLNTVVQLDGSASSDPNQGDSIQYTWTQVDGLPTVTLSDADTATPSFTVPNISSETIFTFSLIVTDNHGLASLPSTTTVTVEMHPIAKAGTAQTVFSGDQVTLDASESRYATSYSWTQTTGTPAISLVNATTATPHFTAPNVSSETTFTFELLASNERGQSHSDTVSITVKPISSSLLINEVSASKYANTERWLELFNNTNQAINLSDYTLKSLAINTNSLALADGVIFELPNITIPPSSYIAIIANHGNRSNQQDLPQIYYLKNDNNQTPFWSTGSTKLGYLELLRHNQTVDYMALGDYSLGQQPTLNGTPLTIAPPTTNSAWEGTSAVSNISTSSTIGYSIARSVFAQDTNTVADWSLKAYSTLAGPNDVHCNIDADQDGIPDCSEQAGSTYAGIDLYGLGARVGIKDLFIEVDYIDATQGGTTPANAGMIPQQEALTRVRDIMAKRGYALHFDVGDLFDNNTNINPEKMDLGGGNQIPYQEKVKMCDPSVNASSIYDLKHVHMHPARRSIFYYMLFAYSQDNSAPTVGYISGCGETLGNDTLITLGKAGLNTDDLAQTYHLINQQASTVMHELGHNLSLTHGGNSGETYQPNYLSIMNYLYSGVGLATVGNNEGDRYHHNFHTNCKTDLTNPPTTHPDQFLLDFSDGSGASIDENNINEHAGLGRTGSKAVDFNCDGKIEAGVSYNLNGGSIKNTLYDYNDWANIQLFFAKRFERDVLPLIVNRNGQAIESPINHHIPDPTWNDVQPIAKEPLTPIRKFK